MQLLKKMGMLMIAALLVNTTFAQEMAVQVGDAGRRRSFHRLCTYQRGLQ